MAALSTNSLTPLLDPARVDGHGDESSGYLDLLAEAPPPSTGLAQSLMLTRVLPSVYERWWRPTGGRLAMGLLGPSMDEERRIAIELLELEPGDTVLDVACGPGNFTRSFAEAVGYEGLAVGVDASPTMLERAVSDTSPGGIAYVRGDALALPFRDASFDAVSCFAALYLFAEPFKAIDEMARVLAPGGRLAILTSCQTGWAPLGALESAWSGLSGVRMFGRGEITEALADRGFVEIDQRINGLAQIVAGRRPE